MKDRQPSLFERATWVSWTLLIASGAAATLCTSSLIAQFAPEIYPGDRVTRGTITIVWLLLYAIFLGIGALLSRMAGFALWRIEVDAPNMKQTPDGAADERRSKQGTGV